MMEYLPMRSSFARCLFAAAMVALTLTSRHADAADDQAVPPRETIRLFDGKSLKGWYPYVQGKGRDDTAGVFAVADGAIPVSGAPSGYLATERAYRDYRLTFEFRWGKRPEGSKTVRNSGVLLHAVGPDGGAGAWMTSIE
ncbi:MAG: DUF1080 domain-containing protein [Pirellulales bacterium]